MQCPTCLNTKRVVYGPETIAGQKDILCQDCKVKKEIINKNDKKENK